MTQVSARIILGIGAVGYPVAFALVACLRWWLGRRGQGWPRILLNTLVCLLLLLALLYGISLASSFGLVRQLPFAGRVALSYGTAGALSLAPWGLALALWWWWRQEWGAGK